MTNKDKLLLHVCCGPCAMYPTKYLIENKMKFDAYFYNPNIHPFDELKLRYENAIKVANIRGYNIIGNLECYQNVWEGFEKNFDRCKYCYQIRLDEVFKYAKNNNYKAVTTSLLASPYQRHELLKKILEENSKKYNVPYFYYDFREGFWEGQREAKANGIYCQKYCGCILSYSESLNYINKLREKKNKEPLTSLR